MIDNFCLLISTLGCLFVILRVSRLDRQMPWFPRQDASNDTPDSKRGTRR